MAITGIGIPSVPGAAAHFKINQARPILGPVTEPHPPRWQFHYRLLDWTWGSNQQQRTTTSPFTVRCNLLSAWRDGRSPVDWLSAVGSECGALALAGVHVSGIYRPPGRARPRVTLQHGISADRSVRPFVPWCLSSLGDWGACCRGASPTTPPKYSLPIPGSLPHHSHPSTAHPDLDSMHLGFRHPHPPPCPQSARLTPGSGTP